MRTNLLKPVCISALLLTLAIIAGLMLANERAAVSGAISSAAEAARAPGAGEASNPLSISSTATREGRPHRTQAPAPRPGMTTARSSLSPAGPTPEPGERIAGLTEAQRQARGITPLALYASRQAGKWMLMALEARELGHKALADEAEKMARQGWAAMVPGAEVDQAELLSQESELLERFYQLNDEALTEQLAELDASLTGMMGGNEPSVKHKLEVAEHGEAAARQAKDSPAEQEAKAAQLAGQD